ncbi:GPW/gp25 family protein [Streptacidiphilus rugosus]|uniref:GPW/gp25 family protein n=1 Tax=Streptacidiphilus rugosus TaxID=405783 RepID=UPI00055A13FF|nr:GPW/gp25 family protein [Streptacidiphilus rugosus]
MTSKAPDFAGIGWAFPMGVNPSGGIAMVRGHDALVKAMRLILTTYPGERPMRPGFGCRLRDYVFAGATPSTAALIAQEVRSSLKQWEPRVDVNSVNVHPAKDDPTLLYIDIQYTMKATADARSLVFPFYTIPEEGCDY